MSSDGSITHWIAQLKAGDQEAAQALWQRYFRRMVGLARTKLLEGQRRAADEEDVALSAFASFCKSAEEGRFPQLTDRDDLWALLVSITAHKASNLKRYWKAKKHGGGKVRGDSALPGDDKAAKGWDAIVGEEPTPEFASLVAEEFHRLLALLVDEELRAIALAKMEGDTVEEIAARLNRSPRTVERRLELIRSMWQRELAS